MAPEMTISNGRRKHMEQSKLLLAAAIPMAPFVVCTVGAVVLGAYNLAKDAQKAWHKYTWKKFAGFGLPKSPLPGSSQDSSI